MVFLVSPGLTWSLLASTGLQSIIFDEVDLTDASVAESSTKNVNNSFTVSSAPSDSHCKQHPAFLTCVCVWMMALWSQNGQHSNSPEGPHVYCEFFVALSHGILR